MITNFSVGNTINECKTDIYFGNGVWNDTDDAEENRKELETLILNKEIIKGDPALQAKYGKVKLAYNWGQGTLFDVLETYYQLRESGQLDGIGFYTAIAALTVEMPEITLSALVTQKLMEPFTKDWEQGNVDEMWQKYYNESFKLGHRVLLVSHSQGNLFANRIFDTINPPDYKMYFANLQVASPASQVKADEVGKGTYVTLWGDPIINPIPGSMSGNAHGSPGHAFIAAYLNQEDPYNKMVSRIKMLLPALDAELSQWQTDQEIERGTCNYRITVKHRFDPSIEMGETVYPFAPNKKLYQVNGEYVKATCGGTDFTNDWDGKKENECWMINNELKEKIVAGCYIASFFDEDDEGWTIIGDAQQGGSKPDYMDGYIQATDDVVGGTWYYSAPAKFSGDLSSCYGDSFSFDLRQSSTDHQFVAQDIIIDSKYGIINYKFGYGPGTSWTPFEKDMIETGWNVNLTEEQFKKILSSVTSILIRGEYRDGFDIGSLDNVIISHNR